MQDLVQLFVIFCSFYNIKYIFCLINYNFVTFLVYCVVSYNAFGWLFKNLNYYNFWNKHTKNSLDPFTLKPHYYRAAQQVVISAYSCQYKNRWNVAYTVVATTSDITTEIFAVLYECIKNNKFVWILAAKKCH